MSAHPTPHNPELQHIRRAEAFKYTVATRVTDRTSWAGKRPQVLTTDGATIRHMVSQPRQIVFQELHAPHAAQGLLGSITETVHEEAGFLGYAMFRHHDQVALMNTGTLQRPGWMARPHQRPLDLHLRHVTPQPRLRLIAGAQIVWSRRRLMLMAALEQRGARFAASPSAFDLLAHLVSWEVHALIRSGNSTRTVEIVAEEQPLHGIQLTSRTRAEAAFALDDSVYRDLRRVSASVWFVLRFDRALMCIPDEWSTHWLEVQPTEPAGLFF